MTNTTPPPDWVLLEAAKRSAFVGSVEDLQYNYEAIKAYRALCDMILKHEQPPVDLISQCAIDVCGDHDAIGRVKCVRAIEMYLERLNAE